LQPEKPPINPFNYIFYIPSQMEGTNPVDPVGVTETEFPIPVEREFPSTMPHAGGVVPMISNSPPEFSH
jgi:hypothetical protein